MKTLIPKQVALWCRLAFAWSPEKRKHVRRSVGGHYRKYNGRRVKSSRTSEAQQAEVRG